MSPGGGQERLVAVRTAVLRLAGLLRMVRIHAPDNRALSDAAEALCDRLRPLLADLGELLVRIDGALVRVNGTVVATLDGGALRELTSLARDLASRELGGIHLVRAPEPRELVGFLATWRALDRRVGTDQVNRFLKERAVESILALPLRTEVEPDHEGHERGASLDEGLRVYSALLAVAELLTDATTATLTTTERRAEAALHLAADAVAAAPEPLLCAVTWRDSERYEVVHTANTTVLAMLLARVVGLGIEGILDVGRGALFCDLGMHHTAADVRHRRAELGESEIGRVMDHPAESFTLALGVGRIDVAARARLAVAWEHHGGIDGEGYPAQVSARAHLYSRICSIADAYDALVHDRADRAGLARPLALEALAKEAGGRFDAALLCEFQSMMGRFPPGSVVRLREGHVAMTALPSPDPRMFDRPDILVIRNPDGRPRATPKMLSLAQQRGERATRIDQVLDDRLFPERLLPLLLDLGR